MPRGIRKVQEGAVQEWIREKLHEANAAFVDAYATTSPKQMANYYQKIMAMRDMAENGFGIPVVTTTNGNGAHSVAATRPVKGFLQDRVKRTYRKQVEVAAEPAPQPPKQKRTSPPRRHIPFTVKSSEFERGVTQRDAIMKTLARADSELTTEQIAVALAERGYPFELAPTSNITEPISTALYKMRIALEVKSRKVVQVTTSGKRKGNKVRMALWSLGGKMRLHVSKEDA